MKLHNGTCTKDVIKRNTGDYGVIIKCLKTVRTREPALIIMNFYNLMTTSPLPKGSERLKFRDLTIPVPDEPFKVGEIERPRICIIPALIMFLSLFAVAVIVKFTKAKDDLAFKMWSYISICHGS